MITISNDGPLLLATNYWDTQHARAGLFFVSWNAGALRLLVPDSQRRAIREMQTGRLFVVTRGPLQGIDCLELMWDDGSDAPYCIHVDMRQSDRTLPSKPDAITVAAYTRAGKQAEWPGRYRTATRLPCLDPWTEH